ncbi:hypothetical protein CONLIGDRAFT_674586 [Coniochaeta ligniaria NRRL 30616]|uniref:Uncharacterized protein n=1 Tax=Coniochaeta ligniaria NRRL 30616 TaxID=1408157 RepID=A0A1J7I793_9PEZI|nr:hypothetical protein CONLIGDRAFT_674586 [Coniochaeta ligniaria NRRL 30616]
MDTGVSTAHVRIFCQNQEVLSDDDNDNAENVARTGPESLDATEADLVLRAIRRYAECRLESTITLPLSPRGHDELTAALELESNLDLSQFMGDKGRIFYNGSSFGIKLPSCANEVFAGLVRTLITDKLREMAASQSSKHVSALIDKVHCFGSAIVDLPHTSLQGCRCPDTSFSSKESVYPFVVVEMAYPQYSEDLQAIAKQYMDGSCGGIKVFLGFDIPTPSTPGDATVSVWRTRLEGPCDVHNPHPILVPTLVMLNKPFQSADGTPVNQNYNVDLFLCDFVPYRYWQDVDDIRLMRISFRQLSEFATIALEHATPAPAVQETLYRVLPRTHYDE